jgi:hypothetical protein
MGLNNFSFASANREGKSDNNIPGGGTLVGGSSLGCGSGIVEESIGAGVVGNAALVVDCMVPDLLGAFVGIEASQSSNSSHPSSSFCAGGAGVGTGRSRLVEAPNPILDFLLVAIWPSKI